jgi:raffinose/stachyose/melibiose transport system substrate-binding protein
MKKKIIYFCILLGMLTMISGCKKKENDDVVTLKFMHRWTMEPMKSATETMIKRFEEENPDIKIEVLTATNSSYKQKIKTVINSE